MNARLDYRVFELQFYLVAPFVVRARSDDHGVLYYLARVSANDGDGRFFRVRVGRSLTLSDHMS